MGEAENLYQMEEQLRKLEDAKYELENGIRLAKEEEQALCTYLDKLKHNTNENKNELRRLNEELEKLNHEVKRLEQELEILRDEKQRLDDYRRQSQHEQVRFNEEIHMHEERFKELQEKVKELEEQKIHLEQQHDQFDQQRQLIEQKLREVAQQIQQIEHQLKELQMRSIQLQEKAHQLEFDIKQKQHKMHQLEQEIDTFDQQRVDLKQKMRDNGSISDRLRQETNKIENSIRRIDEITDMKCNRQKEFEQFTRKLHAEAKEAKERVVQATHEVNAAEQRIKSLKMRVDHLQSELKTLQDILVEGEQLAHDLLEKRYMLEIDIELQNQKRKQLGQEKQNTNNFDRTNIKLSQDEQARDTLVQRVSILQNQLEKFEGILRHLTNERDACAAELERQKLIQQQFEEKLCVEVQRQCQLEETINQEEEQMRMTAHTLDESEIRVEVARTAEQHARSDEVLAQTDYSAAQMALVQAQHHLATASTESAECIEAAIMQCQSKLTQCQAVLTQRTEIHQLKRQERTAAEAEISQRRAQLQQAKTTLQTKQAQLKNQEQEVSIREDKVEIQKATINATVIQVKNTLTKMINHCQHIDLPVIDENHMVQKTYSQMEKQNQTINDDAQQLEQLISSFTQKTQQIDLRLYRLKQKTHYVDQQYTNQLAENQRAKTNEISKLAEQQQNQQYIEIERDFIGEKTIQILQAQKQFQNANANINNVTKSIQELENEQMDQQRLLRETQQQQQKIEREHAQIEAKLASQEQAKQKCDDHICRLTHDIEQQRITHNEKEQDFIALQSQIYVKQQTLVMYQQHRTECEQELATIQMALVDSRRQIIEIDENKRTLERDIEQQTILKQKSEELVLKSTSELDTLKGQLERITRKYIEKQRVYDRTKNTPQILVTQVDRRRAAQADIDQKFAQAQSEVCASREKIARLGSAIAEMNRNIRTKRAICTTISYPNTHFHQDINDEEEDHQHLHRRTK